MKNELQRLCDEINSEPNIRDIIFLANNWFDQLPKNHQRRLLYLGFDRKIPELLIDLGTMEEYHEDFLDYALKNIIKLYDHQDFGKKAAWITKEDASIIPSKTWLVNFSNSAYDVLSKGFYTGIGLSENEGKLSSFTEVKEGYGWNFAYALSDIKEFDIYQLTKDFGEEISLFKSSGVRFYHKIDREYQVMFLGEKVKRIYSVFYSSDWDTFSIEMNDGVTPGWSGMKSLDRVAEWIDNSKDKSKILGYTRAK